MKNIAIVFNHPPHGTSQGREGLDLSLALSDINQVSVFFINAGVLHLLANQQPDKILMRDYIATFGMLELYDISNIYVCESSLAKYHLSPHQLILDAEIISKTALAQQLAAQNTILQF